MVPADSDGDGEGEGLGNGLGEGEGLGNGLGEGEGLGNGLGLGGETGVDVTLSAGATFDWLSLMFGSAEELKCPPLPPLPIAGSTLAKRPRHAVIIVAAANRFSMSLVPFVPGWTPP
jgi:hypothetical protein